MEKAMLQVLSQEGDNLPVGPHDDAEAVAAVRAWQLDKIRRELDGSGREKRDQLRQLLNTDVKLLKGSEHAERLAERHNSMLISPELIAFLELSSEHPDMDVVRDALEQVRVQGRNSGPLMELIAGRISMQDFRKHLIRIANTIGFFLEKYSSELEKNRLESGEYVVGETELNHPETADRVAVADCQVRYPAPGATAAVFELPDPARDMVWNQALVDEMLKSPSTFVSEDDIACIPEASDNRNAGYARTAVYNYILNELNPNRDDADQIEKAVAMIALVQGIERPSGERLYFHGSPKGGLLNGKSVTAHVQSQYGAELAYQLNDRTITFVIAGKEYKILVTWMAYVQDLRKRG